MRNLLFVLLLLFGYINCKAQFDVKTTADLNPGKVCDKCVIRASYLMKFVNDTTKVPVKASQETMMLTVGKSISKFYSYTKFVSDSVYSEAIKKGLAHSQIMDLIGKYGAGKVSWVLYKNYNGKATTTLLDALGMDRFRCDEKEQMPQWQLLPDTMTIIGYSCRKAVSSYKGRTWTAWYTTDIPVHEGPWKLCGLPGMILKASDAKGYYTFEANGIESGKSNDILYKGDAYEPINRKYLNKIYERYHKDPVGYITSNPNMKMTIVDKNGNPTSGPKNMPYNPIEK